MLCFKVKVSAYSNYLSTNTHILTHCYYSWKIADKENSGALMPTAINFKLTLSFLEHYGRDI